MHLARTQVRARVHTAYANSYSYGYGGYSLYATESVPEPMSLAALAVGTAALMRRRRRVS